MKSQSLPELTWQIQNRTLTLKGQITRDSLATLYEQKKSFDEIEVIDVCLVNHVDSAGLALLTQLCLMKKTSTKKLIGASSKLTALIQAYRLPM